MPEKRYIETVGRRKTATTRVRLTPATKTTVEINGKKLEEFFPMAELQKRVLSPFQKVEGGNFAVTALVSGGGSVAQAEAIRHGIARGLVKSDQELRVALKKEGYLKRDPRMKERKKFGLKKARKAPQWSKR
ncbi:MAG: 30S ribosomal protein S9 [Candidatus Paceibacterota bacterium]